MRPTTSLCKKKLVTESVQQPRTPDRINGSRPRQSSRKNKDLMISTWNVRTMLKPGRMKEIYQQMENFKMDLIALQEIRWQGNGRIDKKEFSMLYSGPERRTGLFGTGFMISSKMRKSLLDFEAVNEKLCKIRLKGKFRNITILSIHAPTEDKEETEKEQFYDELERLFLRIQKHDMVIIAGDFNAQIGNNNATGAVGYMRTTMKMEIC